MKIAPLIHSRTFSVDFNSKFAVLPDDFSDSDIEWARSKILPATQNLDILNDVRLVTASNNGKCIAGVACTLKLFAERNGLDAARDFFCDNRGRFVKVFLGISINGATANTIPDVKPADLWKLFEEYLAPEWKRQSPETVLAHYRNVATKNLTPKLPQSAYTFNGVELYEMNTAGNEKLFEMYLALALKQNLAFCTNLDRIQPIEDKIYHAVSTTAEIIDRLKNKPRQSDEEQKKNPTTTETNYGVNTSKLHAYKERISVKEFINRLNTVANSIILVDDGVEFAPTEFKSGIFNRLQFTCGVKKIGERV